MAIGLRSFATPSLSLGALLAPLLALPVMALTPDQINAATLADLVTPGVTVRVVA